MKKLPALQNLSSFFTPKQRKTAFKILSVFIIAGLIANCQSSTPVNTQPQDGPVRSAKGPNEISVMTFNVENMFDATHDENTFDYTYLPLSKKSDPLVKEYCKSISNPGYREECYTLDWSDRVVKFKLSQVGKVISYVENGQGPDNILFAEVENINALSMLFNYELKDLGYQTVVLKEGFDTRGIDVGFASKFPMAKNTQPILHRIPFTDPKAAKSRGILEVTVELPNKKNLTFMSAHFPSQANPTEWRREAFEFIAALMKKYETEGRAVVFGGDLNTLQEEDDNHGYYSKVMSDVGSVSHLVGCKSCKGSHYYKGEWSFLDVMVFGKGLSNANLELDTTAFDTVRAPLHLKNDGTPKRFNVEKMEGVADHLPLYSRLKMVSRPN